VRKRYDREREMCVREDERGVRGSATERERQRKREGK